MTKIIQKVFVVFAITTLVVGGGNLVAAFDIKQETNQNVSLGMSALDFGLPEGSSELLDLRTEKTKTFILPSGKYSAVSRGVPLHYKDEAGVWQDIDLTFEKEGDNYVIRKNSLHLTVTNQGLLILDPEKETSILWSTPTAPVVKNNLVHFSKDELSWAWVPQAEGVKLLSEKIYSPRGKTEIHFPFTSNTKPNIDERGNVSFDSIIIPKPVALGADQKDYSCDWSINGNNLSLSCEDTSWPASAFPYIIDPTQNKATAGSADEVARSGSEGANWSDPQSRARVGDATLSSYGLSSGAYTDWLWVYNWGFTIPSGQIIDSISFVVDRENTGSGGGNIRDSYIGLTTNGSTVGTNRGATSTNWPDSDGNATYDYTTSQWGFNSTTLTHTIVNSSGFGVFLSATAFGGNRSAGVDAIYNMTVTYSPLPTVTGTAGQNIQATGGGYSITINGTGFVSGATVTIGGVSASGVTFVNSTQLTATGPNIGAQGFYDVVVTNPNGGAGTCVWCVVYLSPPTVTSMNEYYAPASTASISRTINGTALGTSTNPKVNTSYGTGVSGNATTLNFTLPSLAAGTYTLRAYGAFGTDNNGIYVDKASYITYVNKPSGLAIDQAYAPANTGSISRTITGSNIGTSLTFPVTVNGSNATKTGSTAGTSVTITIPSLAAGSYTVRVYGANGTASNSIYTDQASFITYVNKPSGLSLNLSSVPSNTSGKTRILTGSNLSTSSNSGCPVKIITGSQSSDTGTCASSVTGNSSQLNFTVPSLNAGSYYLRTYGANGTFANGIYEDTPITYVQTPTSVTSTLARVDALTDGLQLTFTGSYMSTGTYPITIGGVSSTYVSGTSSSLTVSIPSLSAGRKDVRVYGSGGNDTNEIYTDYLSSLIYAPVITDISPQSISNQGGVTVTINGKAMLVGSGGVKIDTATTTTTGSTSSLSFTAPAHATGSVVLTLYGDPNGSDANGVYTTTTVTYIKTPEVSLNDQYILSNTTGTRVITGSDIGFGVACVAKLDGDCLTVQSTSSNSITFTYPQKASGTYTLRVFGNNGSDSAPNNGIYTDLTVYYVDAPSNIAIDDQFLSGNTVGQTRVITGIGLSTSTNPLRIHTSSLATYVSGSSTSITVTMPELSPGAYDARVYGRGGNDTNGIYTDLSIFAIYAPLVTDVDPSQAATIGGETITITGKGLKVGAQGIKVTTPDGGIHLVTTSGDTNTAVTFTSPSSTVIGTSTLRIYAPGGDDNNLVYVETSSLTYVAPQYNQSGFRWFVNANSATPGDPKAAVNASTTFDTAGEEIRLRMLVDLTLIQSPAGDRFKLQVGTTTNACSAGLSYADVSTGSGEIRFFDNTSVSDGSAFSATGNDPTHSGHSNVSQTYQESNSFTTPSTIPVGSDGIWDFSLYNHSARRGVTYCFRMVKGDGTTLSTYSIYPNISVANLAPQVQNVTASQTASGTVAISYEAKDSDSDNEAATPGLIIPSFAYWNGSTWTTITSSSLAATDLNSKSISSSTFTAHTATWTPAIQIPEVYGTSYRIRVTVSDSEITNSTANASSSAFTIDTKSPVISSFSFDSRNDVLTLAGNDDSNLSYILSNSSTLAADGINASSGLTIGVGGTSLSITPSWTGTAASSTELVYVKLIDARNNSTTRVIVTPPTIANFVLADTSNPAAGFYAETLSWSAHTNTASNTVAFYEVWRSTNNTSSFSLIATTTQVFYQNLGLSGSNTYYYRLSTKTSEDNYAHYTGILGDRPDGQGISSNIAPEFDSSFDSIHQTGVTSYQSTSTSNIGQVVVNFSLRDTNATSTQETSLTYEYNIGAGWVTIATSSLTISSTSFTTSSYSWVARNTITGVYSDSARIRVSASDGLSASNAVSAPFTLDTTAPTVLASSLLVNGYTSSAIATSSSAYRIQVQNVTGQPANEQGYIFVTNTSTESYALFSDGTVATTSGTYGSLMTLNAATLSPLSWTWTRGGDAITLAIVDSVGNFGATTSVSVIGINDPPEFQSLTASQATSGIPTAGGLVTINYSIRDTDTSSVTPSFAYSLNGGSWTTIASSSMNSTSTNAKSVASSSYTDYVATWSATTTVTSTYTTDLRVRVTLNDGQSVNNTASSTATITLDSKAPVISSSTLLINGSPTSVESVSSTITLGLQNITGYPADETIYVQFSDDGSTWYGANLNGTLASSSSWGSGFSSASGTLNSLSWPFVISGRSRTIYTRVTDAFGNSIQSDTNSVGYNIPPEFNPAYGTNGISVTQVASSSDNTWGKVLINYNIRDTDTSVGSSTPGFVTPSFEYSVGLGWFPITTSTLGASDTSNKAVGDSSYTTYTATWHASSQLASVYTTTLQVRVGLTDNEPVSGTVQATSSVTILDTKAPAPTVRVDARNNRVSVIATDDSSFEYTLSNVSSLASDGANASSGIWTSTNATSTNTSSSWTLITSSSLNTVYYAVRDTYGNTVSGSASAPIAPASTSVTDVSVASSLNFKELISWTPYVSTSSAPFARYEVYRATTSDPTAFSLLASVTDIAQNYYTDINLTSSTTYYYKVSIVTTNGDYSAYGDTVSDQPDGLSGAAAQGPTISNVATPEVQASWARITWDTDRVSNSQVEYSVATSSSPYGLSTTTETLVIAHNMYVSGLQPNTSYIYRVKSKDVNNKETTSAGGTFTTGGGPIITGVATESVTDHTASITWNTNEDANSTVIYSTTPQNLRDNVDTLEAGNAAMVGAPFQHRVTLSGLNTQTIYYYYVKSTDSDSNISTEKNNGNYFTFSTTQDVKSPVISNITVAAVTKNSAVVTWQTDEPSNSQMTYDTRSASSSGQAHRNTSLLDDNMTTNHAITLTGLSQNTVYYFHVRSIDPAGNLAVSSEQSLTTSDTDAAIVYSTGGGAPTPPVNSIIRDSTPPIISNIEVSNITPFSAKITFDTDEESLGFVAFGETASYGRTLGEASFRRSHSIVITGLRLGTTYHFEVKASDKAGNFTTSLDSTFTTKFAVESVGEIANLDNVEQYQSEIDTLIESVTPSLVTPFIGKIEITELTENSVVIKWTTNTRTYGSVLYVADKDYDAKKENPYLAEVSDTQPRTTTHQVKLSNLAPGQLYRFKIKSYTLPSVVGWSPERTFVTKSSKIRPDIVRLFNTSFVVTWQTPVRTTSFVEYQNIKTKQIRQSGNDTSVIGHVVNVENLDPDTSYRVRAFGYDENKNLVESETITVTTKKDIVPPVITNLKIDNTFVPGRNDRIQTVISWKTDEPANSLVFYGEGSSVSQRQLPNVASSTDSALNTNHNVIISNFKPGTIYQMQVVSVDGAGNRAASPIRVIITPKQTQSVFDVIVKNFEGTFNFINQ